MGSLWNCFNHIVYDQIFANPATDPDAEGAFPPQQSKRPASFFRTPAYQKTRNGQVHGLCSILEASSDMLRPKPTHQFIHQSYGSSMFFVCGSVHFKTFSRSSPWFDLVGARPKWSTSRRENASRWPRHNLGHSPPFKELMRQPCFPTHPPVFRQNELWKTICIFNLAI